MFLQEVKSRLGDKSCFLKTNTFATIRQKKTNCAIFRIKFSS